MSRFLIGILRAVASAAATGRSRHRMTLAALLTLLALAVVAADSGVAGAAGVTISYPENGAVINNAMPTFEGTKDELACSPITVTLQPASSGELKTYDQCPSPIWKATPTLPLNDGTYVLSVEQSGAGEARTFVVDTTPPQVAITSPASGSSATGTSQLLTGTAGTTKGDTPKVKVAVFAGSGTEPQALLQTLEQPLVNGQWSVTAGGLGPGVYTARAEQTDGAGNVGTSSPVMFTLLGSPTAPLPGAAFIWFPSAPITGQRVSLVSTSLDSVSPIVSYAWDLAGNGQFKVAGPVLTTVFAAAGNHVVRLRITDARGFSSTATQTIAVASPQLTLMQPFPIVRVAGTVTPAGVRLSLLAVQTPVGAQVTVSCRGRGCHERSEHRVATASGHARGASSVLLAFRRFERSLRAGVILEIRVQRPGEIGKYTRFVIRRHRLPSRLDQCLAATDPQPIACPA
jgi:PKD domain-containing protein